MEPDRIRASEWILKPLHKMGTNWLHFHCSAKVSAPEVMPLEGAASVTHAVDFPHTRAREGGSESVRALVEPRGACGFTVILF